MATKKQPQTEPSTGESVQLTQLLATSQMELFECRQKLIAANDKIISLMEQQGALLEEKISTLCAGSCLIDNTSGQQVLRAFDEAMKRMGEDGCLRMVFSESKENPAVSESTPEGTIVKNVLLEVGVCKDWH
jgi:hypothetical protein